MKTYYSIVSQGTVIRMTTYFEDAGTIQRTMPMDRAIEVISLNDPGETVVVARLPTKEGTPFDSLVDGLRSRGFDVKLMTVSIGRSNAKLCHTVAFQMLDRVVPVGSRYFIR